MLLFHHCLVPFFTILWETALSITRIVFLSCFFFRKFSAKQMNSVKKKPQNFWSNHTLLCLLYQTGSAVQFMFIRAGGFFFKWIFPIKVSFSFSLSEALHHTMTSIIPSFFYSQGLNFLCMESQILVDTF